MSLDVGARVGRYEVLALLGSGAMGEVYRAHDSRLGRDVAIKVLPEAFAADADRLRRFEQEARAVGALNHPNVIVVHDVGRGEGGPYLVTELLEGDTLRAELRHGPLGSARAFEIASRIAEGLAAAHAKGVIHRDLKPENVFVTADGRIKVLDFGLAKLLRPETGSMSVLETLAGTATEGIALMGTVGYMSPEQARGGTIDHRSDLFALGIVLHEMLSAAHPFARDSAVETLHAILKDEAPAFSEETERESPGIGRIVQRCLAKRPEDRFESARDLAFVLELARARAAGGGRERSSEATPRVAASFKARRVTFRRGTIRSARFGADGQTIVYGAAWEAAPVELFWTPGGSPESRPLDLPETEIHSVSRTGELAVSTGHRLLGGFLSSGTLARVPLGGRAPRELLENVLDAAWGPDGNQLAVIRDLEGMMRVEYPIGNVLYKTGGWVSHLRVSPDGRLVAFLDHPIRGDDSGSVMTVDLEGRSKVLATGWETVQGLAWSPAGDEVCFSAARMGSARQLSAVSLSGSCRAVFHTLGACTLQDVSPRGDVLITQGHERIGMFATRVDEAGQRDLSWFDWSLVRDLTPDGKTILFDETGEGGGNTHAVYIRGTDGSPAIRLGEGVAMKFSPDGRWVISLFRGRSLILLPMGPGQPRTIFEGDLGLHAAAWFPDGERLALAANRPGEGIRLHVLEIDSGKIRPISEEGVGVLGNRVSPDGRWIVAAGPDQIFRLYPTEGGEPRDLPGIGRLDRSVGWNQDGTSLFVYRRDDVRAHVHRLDLATGERRHFQEVTTADPTGVRQIGPIFISRDERVIVASYLVQLHDLYVIEGLARTE